jgi:hypothetical protein
VNNTISTNGGAITISSQNANDINSAVVINGLLDTGTGTGGVLMTSGGVTLNVSPNVGAGNITLLGNGSNLTLGDVTFSTTTVLSVSQNIIVNGTVTTTGNSNLTLFADDTNNNIGGVLVT